MNKLIVFVLMLICIPNVLMAQLLKDFSFMSGEWYTKHAWGEMTEYWSKPMGNVLSGSYQCVQDGKPVFYEFFTIEQNSQNEIQFYLRHFKPGNIAIEEKESPEVFEVLERKKHDVTFLNKAGNTRLQYLLTADDKLKVVLYNRKDLEWTSTVFLFDRLH